MIVIRCTNGPVFFRIARLRKTDEFGWKCLNDNATGTAPHSDTGRIQLLQDIVTHAVALRGNALQMFELTVLG